MKNSIKTALLFLLSGFLFGACEKEDGGAAETPLPAGAVEVRGTLIDIRTFATGKEAFPRAIRLYFRLGHRNALRYAALLCHRAPESPRRRGFPLRQRPNGLHGYHLLRTRRRRVEHHGEELQCERPHLSPLLLRLPYPGAVDRNSRPGRPRICHDALRRRP